MHARPLYIQPGQSRMRAIIKARGKGAEARTRPPSKPRKTRQNSGAPSYSGAPFAYSMGARGLTGGTGRGGVRVSGWADAFATVTSGAFSVGGCAGLAATLVLAAAAGAA